MNTLDGLLEKISSLSKIKNPLLVAIDGRGGSGKSTQAEKLKQKLPNTKIVHLDDFNYPMTRQDYERLIYEVIIPLKSIRKAKYQVYNYKEKKFGTWQVVENASLVVAEGVTSLHPLLRSYFDYTIWVECPAEIGLKRGIKRELKLTGKNVTETWLKFMTFEEEYIQEQRPKGRVDYIIDGTIDF